MADTVLRHPTPSLLCVDDEPNILSALKRLFRPLQYRVLTAGSGAEGLASLEQHECDLVISDMRMPEMDGARFLEQVGQRWPNTMRVLLTGYSDISSTVAAINQGQIYRYVSKPWQDEELLLVVKQALHVRALAQEKAYLLALTERQNRELVALNSGLEKAVAQRTSTLQQALSSLEQAHESLKRTFLASISMISNLMEMRHVSTAGSSKRIADLAGQIAMKLKLDSVECQDIVVAALLRDVGKLALPDAIARKSFEALTPEEREQVTQHPLKGEAALLHLDQLVRPARLIRGQHERWDGKGYPDGRLEFATPRGARILAVASDYESLQRGLIVERCLTPAEARSYIVAKRGGRYDPKVVDAFAEIVPVPPEPAPESA